MLRSAKDPQDKLSQSGVYLIPCSCGMVSDGTTKRSIKTRILEHERSYRLGQLKKNAVAEYELQDKLSTLRWHITRKQRLLSLKPRSNNQSTTVSRNPSSCTLHISH